MNAFYLSSPSYCSVGWSRWAAVGTLLNAQIEPLGTILVTGDSKVSEERMDAYTIKCPEVGAFSGSSLCTKGDQGPGRNRELPVSLSLGMTEALHGSAFPKPDSRSLCPAS